MERWMVRKTGSRPALDQLGIVVVFIAGSLALLLAGVTSGEVSAAPGSAPVNSVPPTITGTEEVGATLTASTGAWTANPGVTDPSGYSFQWQRCDGTPVAGTDWTSRTVPVSYGWRSVTWGGPSGAQKFVAVGGDPGDTVSDDVLISSDGVTWATQNAAANNYWQSVAWGNGTFVAVSNNGVDRVMTSPDGITWATQSAAAARSWKSVTWGGLPEQEKFVAVADDGGIMTSPNGFVWTTPVSPVNSDWRSVIWGGPVGQEKFVAVAYGADQSQRVMTSPDGSTWTARTSAVNNGWYAVTWGGPAGQQKFVAVSFVGTGNQIMTSPDGVNWSAQVSPGSTRQWHSVTWGGRPGEEMFVAVSDTGAPDQVMTSPDGVTWTLRAASSPAQKWRAVTWGGPASNEKFVSVAYDQPDKTTANWTGSGPNRVMTTLCTDIANATTSAYVLQTRDGQKTIRVRVTATNGVTPDGVAYGVASNTVATTTTTTTTAPPSPIIVPVPITSPATTAPVDAAPGTSTPSAPDTIPPGVAPSLPNTGQSGSMFGFVITGLCAMFLGGLAVSTRRRMN